MESTRVAVVFDEKHDQLWDAVFDVFGGKVAREKIDGFKAGAGTVLFFVDEDTVRSMQEQYPRYAGNFPVWAQQANGMLQICVWARLREMGIGANIQHYNPVIDDAVKNLLGLPPSFALIAQMSYGGIVAEPDSKPKEDIDARVKVFI